MAAQLHLVEPSEVPILARPYFATDTETSSIIRALAQVPELLPATMPFLAQILGASAIGLRAKEIVILRVSAQAECQYCIGAHTLAGADAGLSDAELRALRGEKPLNDVFPDDELALVSLSDAIVDDSISADDACQAVRSAYGDHGLVELTLLASATLMLNRFCTALGLPLGSTAIERLAALGMTR